MAFRYKWDQKVDMGTEKVAIYFYRYDTLKEILEETYNSSFDELAGGQVCGGDGRGGEYNLTFEEMVENIELMACFGFACKREGENQIHFWVDVDKVDPVDFIGLISHEKGHILRPWKRDQRQEELKAERYADTATLAFKVACDVLGMELVKKKEPQPINIDDLCIRCGAPVNGKKYYWCKLGPLHKNCWDMSKKQIIEIDD